MELLVTRPHCDTQSEDTVGVSPYILLSVQLTHHRPPPGGEGGSIGHSGCARVPRFPSSPAPSSVLLWLFLLPNLFTLEKGGRGPLPPHLTPNRDNKTPGLLLKWESLMGQEDHPLFPLPKQGLQPNWVKEPSRQQGRCPSGVQWNASVTAGLTSQVSLAALPGSSLTWLGCKVPAFGESKYCEVLD